MLNAPPPAQPSSPQDALEEQLVAYLDRELDESASRQVEELIARDPKVQDAVTKLEEAWDTLDQLGRSDVDHMFTRSTLEMVAVAVEQEVKAEQSELPRRRRRYRLAVAASLLVSAALGFALAAKFWPDPNQQLLADLPILLRLAEYRQVDDAQFLQRLAERFPDGLPERVGMRGFAPTASSERNADGSDASALAVKMARADLEARRSWVRKLDADGKAALDRSREEFDALPTAERERIGRLHAAIVSSDNSDALWQAMSSYSRWVKTLPLSERMELEVMPFDERLASIEKRVEMRRNWELGWQFWVPPERVAELVKKLPGNELPRLSPEDREVLATWMREFTRDNAGKLDTGNVDENWKEWFRKMEPDRRHDILARVWLPRRLGYGEDAIVPSSEELARLRSHLSPDVAEWLARLTPDEQTLVLRGWTIQVTMRPISERVSQGRFSRGSRPPSPGSDEDYAQFLEDLPEEKLAQTLSGDAEQAMHELWQQYLQDKAPTRDARRSWPGGDFGPGGRGPGGPRPPRENSVGPPEKDGNSGHPPGGPRPSRDRFPPRREYSPADGDREPPH